MNPLVDGPNLQANERLKSEAYGSLVACRLSTATYFLVRQTRVFSGRKGPLPFMVLS